MKTVLFCGGLGLRLREYADNVPKPLVPIGDHPVMWHLMKYYSHYGHRDFVLCLGHKSEAIKRFFLNYNEALSTDFVLADGGRRVELLSADFCHWNITFADTGYHASIGERLYAVREYLRNEPVFLANYIDGLSDLDLNQLIDVFSRCGKTACFVSVRPTQTFHVVEIDDAAHVTSISHAATSNAWMNGGYFIFSQRIFDFMRPGEDLVEQPFRRLIAARELVTLKHDGFWACMDTFKEKQQLEDLWSKGAAPWHVWSRNGASSQRPSCAASTLADPIMAPAAESVPDSRYVQTVEVC